MYDTTSVSMVYRRTNSLAAMLDENWSVVRFEPIRHMIDPVLRDEILLETLLGLRMSTPINSLNPVFDGVFRIEGL